MRKQLYIGQKVIKPSVAINTLEKNIKILQAKLKNVELMGPPGKKLKAFYSQRIELQYSMLKWFTQLEQQKKTQR